MEYRGWVYWVLYLSSYAPLFVIFAIRNLSDWVVVAATLGLALSASLMLLVVIRGRGRINPEQLTVEVLSSRGTDVAAYVTTYLIPFVFDSAAGPRDWASLALLIVTVGVVYVRSRLIYVNPLLGIAGYRVFEIKMESGQVAAVIARSYLRDGPLRAHRLADGVLLEARIE